MGVDAVRLEVIGECPKAQFVEDTTLINAEIVLDFTEAPVCEVLGIVVDLRILETGLP